MAEEKERVKLVKLRYTGHSTTPFGGRVLNGDDAPFVWLYDPADGGDLEVPEFVAQAILSDPAGSWSSTDERARYVSPETAAGEAAANFGTQPLPETAVTVGEVVSPSVTDEKRKR